MVQLCCDSMVHFWHPNSPWSMAAKAPSLALRMAGTTCPVNEGSNGRCPPCLATGTLTIFRQFQKVSAVFFVQVAAKRPKNGAWPCSYFHSCSTGSFNPPWSPSVRPRVPCYRKKSFFVFEMSKPKIVPMMRIWFLGTHDSHPLS